MPRDPSTLLRKFHEAKWDEQIILEMSVPGERGILVREVEPGVRKEVGTGVAAIPPGLRRKEPPKLPEINQMRVLRHFMRLSQETMGTDLTIDISQGTCTMKYSPKVQEHIAARHPGIREIHPLQPRENQCVRAAHEAGALCYYDQANANGMLGIARARDAGFDLCHFNLHKTFSVPHGSMGGAVGALGVARELAKFLPIPRVEYDKQGKRYYLDYDAPDSI